MPNCKLKFKTPQVIVHIDSEDDESINDAKIVTTTFMINEVNNLRSFYSDGKSAKKGGHKTTKIDAFKVQAAIVRLLERLQNIAILPEQMAPNVKIEDMFSKRRMLLCFCAEKFLYQTFEGKDVIEEEDFRDPIYKSIYNATPLNEMTEEYINAHLK